MGLSFGGFVAQAYALRHPEHLSKLILASTTAQWRIDRALDVFERLGGKTARDIAERFWGNATDPDVVEPYFATCFPLYNQTPQATDMVSRSVMNPAVFSHFFQHGGEGHRFNFLPELQRIQCPSLIVVGEEDPITPVADAQDMAAAGIDILAIMQAGGWKSPEIVARYVENLDVLRGGGYRLAMQQNQKASNREP